MYEKSKQSVLFSFKFYKKKHDLKGKVKKNPFSLKRQDEMCITCIEFVGKRSQFNGDYVPNIAQGHGFL